MSSAALVHKFFPEQLPAQENPKILFLRYKFVAFMAVSQNFKYFDYKHILPCFEISKMILPLHYEILTFLQITQTLANTHFNVITV